MTPNGDRVGFIDATSNSTPADRATGNADVNGGTNIAPNTISLILISPPFFRGFN
jgi:hypothetical protein